MSMSKLTGSSPLTRGKQDAITRAVPFSRLIPAHAGKTTGPCSGEWNQRAHPRSRGENRNGHATGQIALGSSPLTRGKPPAGWRARTSLRAHPRSRGENERGKHVDQSDLGSSPLTRGKRVGRRRRPVRDGLIPAHAGKTCGRTGARTHARAHPRSRGENPC